MESHNYMALALLLIIAWFLYTQLYTWRFKKYSHIPSYFPTSLVLGNLKIVANEYRRIGDYARHPDYIFYDLWKSVGFPEIFLFDSRPANYAILFVTSHKVAEQVSKASKLNPVSVPKSPTLQGILRHIIGKTSLLSQEGDTWKQLRKRFNPGFAPQHLLSLLPQIMEKTCRFMDKLDALCESGNEFEMDPLCTDLTFDIIGKVVTNIDCNAQDDQQGGNDIVRSFRKLLETNKDTGQFPRWVNLPKTAKRIFYSIKADSAVKECIKQKFRDMKEAQGMETEQNKDRSVLALSLKETDVLTPDILQITADQVKSFLFAGHDTTSILLQRLFYALSIHPRCLAAIRAEHDAVFGDSDPREIILARPDETIKALSYTSACIKEGLRLWPPAGSARLSPRHKGFKVRLSNGEEMCVDGTVIYLCHYIIHRDPAVYGKTAEQFMPERWLGDVDTSATRKDEEDSGDSQIPISAWRPFERGPRNCIGQELANLEARVILACVMRKYDFIKVGAGEVELDEKGIPVVDDKGSYKTKSELYNLSAITAKPSDSRMRIKIHDES